MINFFAFAQTDTIITSKGVKTKGDSLKTRLAASGKVFETSKVKQPLVRKTASQVFADSIKRKRIAGTPARPDSTKKWDSLVPRVIDTTRVGKADTAEIRKPPLVIKKPIDSIYLKLLNNPFITKAKPIYLIVNERERNYKDEVFYLLCGLLLFLAFIKLIFSKYFKNIFKLFFQPAFRQKQTREQMLQSNLPSLLLNLFFIFSSGIYLSFLLQYYHHTDLGFWWLLLYTTASLLVLYLGKFIFLSFAGWVFDAKEATEAYIFAVNLINKIAGVVLIPFTLIIAFSSPSIINISVTISGLIISLLFVYRYLVSYPSVRKELRVSILHFFFYIFAFEIMPLLLICKTLIIFLNNSH